MRTSPQSDRRTHQYWYRNPDDSLERGGRGWATVLMVELLVVVVVKSSWWWRDEEAMKRVERGLSFLKVAFHQPAAWVCDARFTGFGGRKSEGYGGSFPKSGRPPILVCLSCFFTLHTEGGGMPSITITTKPSSRIQALICNTNMTTTRGKKRQITGHGLNW
jgi:hypothetical protein